MARERDPLAEICLLVLNERELRGRGAAADELCDAIERSLDGRHVEALIDFAEVCQARLRMRGRRLVDAKPSQGKRLQ
jgi:hypothetical protein